MASFRLLVLTGLALFCFNLNLCLADSTKAEELSDESPLALTEPEVALTAKGVLETLSLDQKIGQLLFLGLRGQKYDGKLRNAFSKIRPGGIVIFRRNIKSAQQIAHFNHQLQTEFLEKNTVPIFVAIDQEGGLVTRIKSNPPLPSALSLGQTNNEELVRKIGFYTGSLMRSLGFNMNLAPVLDISDPAKPSFIGTRSFSGDHETVSRMARSFSGGLKAAGIVATLKHFPGHGGPAGDSHTSAPVMTENLDGLLSFHLKPFTYMTSNSDVPAVMVAHVVYPRVDNQPATYSKVIIEDLLRKKLNFKGLIITDDIQMAGAKKFKDPGEQAVRSLRAGVDMVMVAWSEKAQIRAFETIKKAVTSGKLSIERIDQSVERILETKLQYGLFAKPPTPSLRQINTAFNDPSFRQAVDSVMLANIKKSFEKIDMLLPLPQDQKIAIFSLNQRFHDAFVDGVDRTCCEYIKLSSQEKLISDLRSRSDQLSIFYASGKKTLSLVSQIPKDLASNILVINTSVPGAIKNGGAFRGVVNLYSPHSGAGLIISKYLFSERTEAPLRQPSSETARAGEPNGR